MFVKTQRAYWVDFAKLIAILAVLTDHTSGILYANQRVTIYSYFSVNVFIIIMGVTSYWSYSKYTGNIPTKVLQGCWKILRPYIIATFVYGILIDNHFNFLLFLNRLVHFSASEPFYFVLLYIQLLFVVPLFYYFLLKTSTSKYECVLELLALFIVLIVSGLTTTFTNILDVWGGGGKLFGGTYLILLYIGMLFGKHLNQLKFQRFSFAAIVFLFIIIVTIAWANYFARNPFQLDSHFTGLFGYGLNPPSISLIIYAILVTLTVRMLDIIAHFIPIASKTVSKVALLGKHTLYIFLYHRIFLDFFIPRMSYRTRLVISNIWFLRLFYFVCMIGGSIIIEFVFEKVHSTVVKIYSSNTISST